MNSHSPGGRRSERRSALHGGFTLIELLVVIAVIAMIAALAVPAIEPMMKGSKLTTAADNLRFTLSGYRQRAIAENEPIEVRFLKYIDPSAPGQHEAYRGFIAGRFRQKKSEKGGGEFVFEPLSESKLEQLPDGVVFSSLAQMSSLLSSDKVRKGQHEFIVAGQNNLPFVSFSFRPDGSTDLPKRAGDTWYVTIVQERDDVQINPNPDNFVTAQVDAFNGAIRLYTR